MIEALLFDAAGTLIIPAKSVGETYSELLQGHGYRFDPETMQRRFIDAFRAAGHPDYRHGISGDEAERVWWRKIVEHCVGSAVSDEVFASLFNHYEQPASWTVISGVEESLHRAKSAGFRLAVVSNFDLRLHVILEGLGLSGYFETILTSAEASCRKPESGIFHGILDRLGLEAAQTMLVGDSPGPDGEGAAKVGIESLIVKRGGPDLSDFIDHAIRRNRK